MRVFRAIREWFLGARRSAANRIADDWVKDSTRLLSRLDKQRVELTSLLGRTQDLSVRMQAALDQAEQLERQRQTALDGLRQENKVLLDCALKPLEAQNRMLINMWDAQTAVAVRQQTAARAVE